MAQKAVFAVLPREFTLKCCNMNERTKRTLEAFSLDAEPRQNDSSIQQISDRHCCFQRRNLRHYSQCLLHVEEASVISVGQIEARAARIVLIFSIVQPHQMLPEPINLRRFADDPIVMNYNSTACLIFPNALGAVDGKHSSWFLEVLKPVQEPTPVQRSNC